MRNLPIWQAFSLLSTYKWCKMKKFVTLFIIILCSSIYANAQTYLEHLQKKVPGEGVVTVRQSKEIDELVNGKSQVVVTKEPEKKQTIKKEQTKAKTDSKATIAGHTAETVATNRQQGNDTSKRNGADKHNIIDKKENTESKTEGDDFDIPTLDLRKKVPRNIYKVPGFRVQVFSGGNSRADRQRAESIRDQLKINFPEEPVYVHFYSPRWICRVGNYRSMEEADIILRKIQAIGYKQAYIVKGKITVSY